MNLSFSHQLYKALENDNLSFIYQGNFSNVVLAMATDLMKNDIDSDSKFSSLGNKLSFLMIENFQNIIRYADKNVVLIEELGQEMFMTRHIGDAFYIVSANPIENNKIEGLKSRLDKVNTLDKDDLKKLYVEVLTNRKLSNEGGAGLGFIEMVRKTNEKLEFDFVKHDENFSYFYFKIKLRAKGKDENVCDALPIQMAKDLHQQLIDQNVLMVHRGDFSQDAINPVLRMVENNIDNHELGKQKKIYHLLVEVLQNISKHSYHIGDRHEGIFLMSRKNDSYIISSGNFIENEKIEKLKGHLLQVQGLNHKELDKFYKQILCDGEDTDDGNAGLGLIDIAREASESIQFEFIPINDKISFYTFWVKQ